MYSVAAIIDNRNHKLFLDSLKEQSSQVTFSEIPLNAIISQTQADFFLDRIRTVKKIKQWIKEGANYDSVLIFSDYSFAYRTLTHYCRYYKKPVFLYQDGFIVTVPWPRNISGFLRRLVYLSLRLTGCDYLMSYKSFHSNPDLVFSWGDFFSGIFKNSTCSEVTTVGTLMYKKEFHKNCLGDYKGNKILFYATYYRDFDKDKIAKEAAADCLKRMLYREQEMICDVKLHPLDENRQYLEELLQPDLLNNRIRFLNNDFLLSENIPKYKYVISEFSTETVFASMFCSNICFVKTELNENHFNTIKRYLVNIHIGIDEFHKINQDLIESFRKEYFQVFNMNLFEQSLQKFS